MTKQVFNESSMAELPQRVRANFINSLSGFKSANLVGTTGANGIHNLAMVSSVFHIGASPPLLGMIMRPHTVVRDTLENIKAHGVYTINGVHKSFTAKAHQCSARYDKSVSEFDAVGLTVKMATCINAPYVAESPVKIALAVEQITLIDINQTELVIGKVVEVICDSRVLCEDGCIDLEAAGGVAVSGLDSYHATQAIARYSYAKPDSELETLGRKKHDT